MISALLELLRPSSHEVVALAKREAEPRFFGEFEPLHLGPALSLLMLVVVGVAGVLSAPFRIASRLRESRK